MAALFRFRKPPDESQGADVDPSQLTPLAGFPGQFVTGQGKGADDGQGNSVGIFDVYNQNGHYLGQDETVTNQGVAANYGYSYGSPIPTETTVGSSGPLPPPTYGGFPTGAITPTYGGFPAPGVANSGSPTHGGMTAFNDTLAPAGSSVAPSVTIPVSSQSGDETQRDVTTGPATSIAINIDEQGNLKNGEFAGTPSHNPGAADPASAQSAPSSNTVSEHGAGQNGPLAVTGHMDTQGRQTIDQHPLSTDSTGIRNSGTPAATSPSLVSEHGAGQNGPLAMTGNIDTQGHQTLNIHPLSADPTGTRSLASASASSSTAASAVEARSEALNKAYGLGDSSKAASTTLHSTAPVGFTDTSSSAQAANPAHAYMSGAAPVKVEELKNGATLTTTSTGAQIEQMPGQTAYQVKAPAVADTHLDPAIQTAMSSAAPTPTPTPTPPISTGPAFTTPPAQHFGDVTAGGGLSALDPGTNVHHMGRSSMIEL